MNKKTLKARLLSPYDQVDVVCEDNEVKLKNQMKNAFEELNKVIKDDLEEVDVINEESALEYFYKLRHSDE